MTSPGPQIHLRAGLSALGLQEAASMLLSRTLIFRERRMWLAGATGFLANGSRVSPCACRAIAESVWGFSSVRMLSLCRVSCLSGEYDSNFSSPHPPPPPPMFGEYDSHFPPLPPPPPTHTPSEAFPFLSVSKASKQNERDRQTETDRQTDRQTGTERGRQKDKQTTEFHTETAMYVLLKPANICCYLDNQR